MGVRYRTVSSHIMEINQAIEGVSGKKVSVGVLGGGENSYLASIHEYGCRILVTDKMRHYLAANGLHLKKETTYITIPERSFLRNGFAESKDEVVRKANQVLGEVVSGRMPADTFLDMVGLMLSTKIKTYARNLDSPQNHPYTIVKKGSSNPLVDSGNMIEAITYKVE